MLFSGFGEISTIMSGVTTLGRVRHHVGSPRLWDGNVDCTSNSQHFVLQCLKKCICIILYPQTPFARWLPCRRYLHIRDFVLVTGAAGYSRYDLLRLFLAALLGALVTRVHGALATSLGCHLFASLLVYLKCQLLVVSRSNESLCCLHTGALLLHVSKVIFVEVLVLLLGSLQRLDLATFSFAR